MEREHNADTLKKALNGDINAFQSLFTDFQNPLRAYLYRLLTDRNDALDIAQDTFVRAFDKISTFKGQCSLKTWVFQIATNLAYNHLKKFKRWTIDAQDKSKALAIGSSDIQRTFRMVHQTSAYGCYEIREHIDFCFTCISKTLTIDRQVALILKDIYDFSVKEICIILSRTEGVVKHLLIDSRKTMTAIFESRCALVNKKGICHQCSELNGAFNPKQNQQEALIKLDLIRNAEGNNHEELYELRAQLVRGIDPLRNPGADLQDVIMKCTRLAIGEIEELN